jgi:type I restriction enzyme S subunit
MSNQSEPRCVRFKYLADLQKGHLPSETFQSPTSETDVPYLSMEYLRGQTDAPDFTPCDPWLVLADEGDTLLLWDGANAGEFMRSKKGAVSSTAALVSNKHIDRDFLFWSCKCAEPLVRAETVGMGIPHVNGDFLADYRMVVPLPRTQAEIGGFLNRETGRLDALVAAKERWLELLAEKRSALITRAVTRGLNPAALLRDSGFPWLGQVPNHWQLVPLRYLSHMLGGATPDKGNSEFWSGNIPWVSPKDMKRDEISDSEDHISESGLNSSPLQMIPVRSVLIVVRGMILLHSFPTAITGRPVTINQDMKALVCRPALQPEFLQRFMQGYCNVIVSFTGESAHGTRKLESEVLGKLQIPLPTLAEQRAIVAHIASATAKLDGLRAAAERTIALLKERRAALIAAAVTGKLSIN